MDFSDELSLIPGVESVWVTVDDGDETLTVDFDDDPSGERSMDIWRIVGGRLARVLISDVSIRVNNDELLQIVQAVAAGNYRTEAGCLHVRLPDGAMQSYC
ncbi:hypothetical protein [Oerskovia enterophila]|uniref:hypothetical protein n=1 Tax=Oerskovia enterophila TaxID=43678 RepID=UPI0011123E19|nr:hypothetical protein [Oerskovia enterophila]